MDTLASRHRGAETPEQVLEMHSLIFKTNIWTYSPSASPLSPSFILFLAGLTSLRNSVCAHSRTGTETCTHMQMSVWAFVGWTWPLSRRARVGAHVRVHVYTSRRLNRDMQHQDHSTGDILFLLFSWEDLIKVVLVHLVCSVPDNQDLYFKSCACVKTSFTPCCVLYQHTHTGSQWGRISDQGFIQAARWFIHRPHTRRSLLAQKSHLIVLQPALCFIDGMIYSSFVSCPNCKF